MTAISPQTDDSAPCLVFKNGGALVVRFNRPRVRNALNMAMWDALSNAITQANQDQSIRALIVTGTPEVFSAGGDMKNVESHGDGLMRDAARLQRLQNVLAEIAGAEVPVLAAVEGPAVGVAWGLALTCDYLIASQSARFMAPFGQRSLVPDGGIGFQLVKSLGRLQASKILFGNGSLDAQEAFELGLVTEVTAQGAAEARALEIAGTLEDTSRDTLKLTKRLLRRADHSCYRDYLNSELEIAALNLHNPELAQARMSFKKK